MSITIPSNDKMSPQLLGLMNKSPIHIIGEPKITTKLVLCKYGFTYFPTAIWELLCEHVITELHLSHNNIEEITDVPIDFRCPHPDLPPDVFRHLKILDLSHNAIKSCDLEIATIHAPKLEGVWLNNNKLTEIPEWLWTVFRSLNNLKVLDLSNNQITSIPTIPLPYGLRDLRLSHNLIEDIPTIIESHPKLRVLKLDHNRISTISNRIGNLRKLQLLDLTGNYDDDAILSNILPIDYDKQPNLYWLFNSNGENISTKQPPTTELNYKLL